MSKKHHGGPAPVPPANRQQIGPESTPDDPAGNAAENAGDAFSEQDPKRRLGGYGTAGEHPIQQPTKLNDGS
jgi:hypothetical protein